jgi:DNA-binding response OmpR family regulator
MRLLLVEDQPELAHFLYSSLTEACFAVDVAGDGVRGSYLGSLNDYDLAILDYNLPKKNGREVCRAIREAGKKYPIIMLSIEGSTPKKVELLNSGADDYMTKPFSLEELLARIRAILRRPHPLLEETLLLDDLSINTRTHLVKRGDKEIYLTKKEFMLLEHLLKNTDTVISRGSLIEHVWDNSGDIFSNTIETHILTLRKKIDSLSRRKLIKTVPGRGYKISSKITS